MDTNSYATQLRLFKPTAATAVTELDMLLADSDSPMFYQRRKHATQGQE
jgi:hypothetical protein